MFEIREVKENCDSLVKKFCLDEFSINERVFALYEGDVKGIAVIELQGGAVLIKAVTDCGSFGYKDALIRALLAVIKNFNPICVKVKSEEYYLRFGFNGLGEFMQIMSDKIVFACPHK